MPSGIPIEQIKKGTKETKLEATGQSPNLQEKGTTYQTKTNGQCGSFIEGTNDSLEYSFLHEAMHILQSGGDVGPPFCSIFCPNYTTISHFFLYKNSFLLIFSHQFSKTMHQ